MSSDSSPAGPADWQVRSDLRCELGEGLFWEAASSRLWFVDILSCAVHALELEAWRPESWNVGQFVGWVIPTRQAGDWLLGLQEGVARATLGSTGARVDPQWLVRAHPWPSPLRLNDAKADALGAVWAGSMNHTDSSQPQGALHRLGPDGSWTVHDTGYHVANGPAIRGDGRLMLHTDSAQRTIYAFDLDAAAGSVGNKRTWLRFADDEGYPDGMCFDAEGCVWIAHWDGACITRRDPQGAVIRRVELPAPRITNVCFGGPALDRLFVTSARVGLGADQLARYPRSGALFEVDALGVRGLPLHGWAGV